MIRLDAQDHGQSADADVESWSRYSQASASIQRPRPNLPVELPSIDRAPQTTVGSKPAADKISPAMAVVVDLPCVPAIGRAVAVVPSIVRPSAGKLKTGTPSARARRSSGFSLGDRVAMDQQVELFVDVLGVMGFVNVKAGASREPNIQIRAADFPSGRVEHLGQRTHARAGDANQVRLREPCGFECFHAQAVLQMRSWTRSIPRDERGFEAKAGGDHTADRRRMSMQVSLAAHAARCRPR